MKPKFEAFRLTADLFDPAREINLENLYNLCTAELTLQQTKRDQIIAFYVAIASFLIPTAYEMELSAPFRAAAFALVAFIGAMLCRVVVRYRVYKEVYWVTARTITALMRAKPEKLEKALVQHLFAKNLQKSMPSVVAYDTEERDGVRVPARIRRFATVRKQQNSAETMLYLLIVVMTAVPAFLAALCLLMRSYSRALADLYAYCFDGSDASFNRAYSKAWFLHGFDMGENLDA